MNLVGWLKRKASQKVKETRSYQKKTKNFLKEINAISFSLQGDGPRKTECQDSFTIIDNHKPEFYLYGIFDGHGNSGKEASIAASENIHKFFEKNVEKIKKINTKFEMEQLMKKAFQFVEKKMKKSGINYNESGTCALVILIKDNIITIANLGDSRAVLCRQEKETLAIEISIDHKPTRKEEKKRILEHGGKIEKLNYNGECIGPYRVWVNEEGPGYAITRSLGDLKAKKIGYISDPEIDHLNLKKQDKFIVLASDGVWDVMSSAEVVGYILQNEDCWGYDNKMAEKLSKEARQRWEENNTQNTFNNRIGDFPSAKYGIDDITVIICFLNFTEKLEAKNI